mmetsp:Transcript_28249/g.79018  ORF Transcript_28249/g.79018 Transcript_28249/m.79018 type:complete len:93 (-) Transcript_28249:260-538(-)
MSTRHIGTKVDPASMLYIKTMTGKVLSVNRENMRTVRDLKEDIATNEGVPVDKQTLITSGRAMENSAELSSYNLSKSGTLHLLVQNENPEAR